MMHRIGAAGVAALLPMAAQAECLGQGCYDGLGLLVGLLGFAALGVAGLCVALIVAIARRRWRSAKILAAIIFGPIVLGALVVLL